MDPELKKLLDALKGYADKGKLVSAIKDDPEYADLKNGIYQPAFNDGHGVATAAHAGAKTRLENEARTAAEAKTRLEQEFQRWKESNPDAAKLHDEYGRKLQEKDSEIARINEGIQAEKRKARLDALQTSVQDALVKKGVNPVLAQALALTNRERFVEDNGATRILQKGQSIAFAGDETAQISALTTELLKDVPADMIRSTVPGNGANDGKGESAGGDGTAEKKTKLAEIRAKTQAQYAKQSQTAGAPGTAPALTPEQQLAVATGRSLRNF